MNLPATVRQDVPELGIKAKKKGAPSPEGVLGGCSVSHGGGVPLAVLLLSAVLSLVLVRRNRHA